MKKAIQLFAILLMPLSLVGQLTPVTSQYILNPLTINPAYAGNRGALNIAAFYRKQWIGVAGSPETMTLSADAPLLADKLGLGVIITNDKIGVTKETRVNTNYSYKLELKKGVLSLGLGAGIITTNTAWSDLVVLDPEDSYFLIDSRVFAVPDFSFGAYYSYKSFFAGFSIPKLLGYNFNFDRNRYTIKFEPSNYNYLLNAGYIFTINSRVRLFPSTLVSYSPGGKMLCDINAHVNLFEKLWTGLSYRSSKSVSGLVQFAVNNQIRVAYTYDIDLGRLGRYSNGSHEIMLRYEFRYKVEVINPLSF
jgi:type IX secretion system PorP/SprF family membrane protein